MENNCLNCEPFFLLVEMGFLLSNLLICTFVTVVPALKTSQAEGGQKLRSPVVQTDSGAVVGNAETLPLGQSVYEYLGIPYAEAPVRDARFAAPQPVKPWSGIKETMEFGASCLMPFVPGMTNSSMLFFCI